MRYNGTVNRNVDFYRGRLSKKHWKAVRPIRREAHRRHFVLRRSKSLNNYYEQDYVRITCLSPTISTPDTELSCEDCILKQVFMYDAHMERKKKDSDNFRMLHFKIKIIL